MKPIIVISIPSKNNGIGGIPNNITQAGVSPLVITTWTSLFFRLPTRCLSASLKYLRIIFLEIMIVDYGMNNVPNDTDNYDN